MSRASSAAVALVVGLGLLAIMAWFDAVVLLEAQQRAHATFDSGQANLLLSLGSFAVAGSVLLVARLAIGSRSVAVGVIYLIVGGFFALLPWTLFAFATNENGVPPLLPDPLAIAVADIYLRTMGPLHAVQVIGAGMAIAGIAVLFGSRRERR